MPLSTTSHPIFICLSTQHTVVSLSRCPPVSQLTPISLFPLCPLLHLSIPLSSSLIFSVFPLAIPASPREQSHTPLLIFFHVPSLSHFISPSITFSPSTFSLYSCLSHFPSSSSLHPQFHPSPHYHFLPRSSPFPSLIYLEPLPFPFPSIPSQHHYCPFLFLPSHTSPHSLLFSSFLPLPRPFPPPPLFSISSQHTSSLPLPLSPCPPPHPLPTLPLPIFSPSMHSIPTHLCLPFDRSSHSLLCLGPSLFKPLTPVALIAFCFPL